jgi:AcrR family transcriptional regulator
VSVNDENPRGIDRRALRTQHLLAEALMSLGAARGLDSFDVAALVDTAGVARSTFYTHFADKDDFLVRSFVNMIATAEAALAAKHPERDDLLPSQSLFAHIHAAGDFARAVPRSQIYLKQMAAGEAKLRDIAETNLARLKPDWPHERRRDTAIYVAGGFIGLVRWWMESGLKQSPEHMQQAFARLSRNSLADP